MILDKQKVAAAKMAGEWWAERLAEEYAAQRNAFAASVEKRVLQELRGECYWDWDGEQHKGLSHKDQSFTEQDYDPHYCLIPALAETLFGVPEWKMRNALPNKHELEVTPTALKPKEGYGNWTATISVPAVGAA